MLNLDTQKESDALDNRRLSSVYLTLAQAARRLPRRNGTRIHASTLWRWCRRGCRGIYLQHLRLGRTIVVTEETLHKFFMELSQADIAQRDRCTGKPVKRRRKPAPNRRLADQQQSDSILRRARILV